MEPDSPKLGALLAAEDHVEKLVEDVLQRHSQKMLTHLDEWLRRVDLTLQKHIVLDVALDPNELDAWCPDPSQDASDINDLSKDTDMDKTMSEHPDRPEKVSSTRQLDRSQSYLTAKEEESRLWGLTVIVSSWDLQTQRKRLSWLAQKFRPFQAWASKLVLSAPFNVFFALVILSNSLYLGIQVEWSATHGHVFTDPGIFAAHMVYMILFSVEIMLRCLAVGPVAYVCGEGWAWHWLDLVAVLSSWVELVVDLVDKSGTYSAAASNFRIMRIFRITRLVKVVRSLTLVRFVSALRTLVHSIADTTKSLVWSLLLLLLIQYTFGILFTDATLDYLAEHGSSTDESVRLQQYFGSVWKATETLFRSLLGGFDWANAADAVRPMGELWVLLFHWYIAFCNFAVLNVMTGVFCHSAIRASETDHLTMLQNRKRFQKLLRQMFSKLDVDGSGQLTVSQFERLFEDEDMKAFFEAIEIDAVDAWTLFASLDVNGDNVISADEFVQRCMQLHGSARSVDLYALKQQNQKLRQHIDVIDDDQKILLGRVAMLARSLSHQQQLSLRAQSDLRANPFMSV